MPIVRDLIQTVVIGKTQGRQPASLPVDVEIENTKASLEVPALPSAACVGWDEYGRK